MSEEVQKVTHRERRVSGTAMLKYTFTETEKLALGDKMAEAQEEIDRANDELTSLKTQLKARIAQYEAVRSGNASKIRTGWEYRTYDTTTIHNFDEGTVVQVRDDTGEVIATRAMMGDERQMEMDFRIQEPPEEPVEKEAEPGEAPADGAEA